MTLRTAPLEDIFREVETRGYRIAVLRGGEAGDVASLPAVPLGAASLPDLLSALSARGWDVSDVREALPPLGVDGGA